MLDIKFIRENPDAIKRACQLKGFEDKTDEILALIDKSFRGKFA
jgi:seryl-tRNA synthetase